MAINRYSTPAIAQFNPLSYDEIMAIPMAQYQEYGRMLEEMNAMPTEAKALPTAKEYLQKGQAEFEQKFNTARESLDKYGAFASKGVMLDLRKSYQDFKQNYMMPVEQHYTDVREAMKEASNAKGWSAQGIGNMQQRMYNSNPINPKTGEFVGYDPIPIQDGIDLMEHMDKVFKNVNVDKKSLDPSLHEFDGLTLLRKGHIKPGDDLFSKLVDKMETEFSSNPVILDYLYNSDLYEGTGYYTVDENGRPVLKETFVEVPADDPSAAWVQKDADGNLVGVAWNMDSPLAVKMRSYIYGAVSTEEDFEYSFPPEGTLDPNNPKANSGGPYGGMAGVAYLPPDATTGEHVLRNMISTGFINPVMEEKYAAEDRYVVSLMGVAEETKTGNYKVGELEIPKEDMLRFIAATEYYQEATNGKFPSPAAYAQMGISIQDMNDPRVLAYNVNPGRWSEVLQNHEIYEQYLGEANMVDGMSQERLAVLEDKDVEDVLKKYFGSNSGWKHGAMGNPFNENQDISYMKDIPYQYNVLTNKEALGQFLSSPKRFQDRALKGLSDPKYKEVYGAYSAYLAQAAKHVPQIADALAEQYVKKTGVSLEDLDIINSTGRTFSLKGLSTNPAKPHSPAQNAALTLGNTLQGMIQSGGADAIVWGKKGSTGGEKSATKSGIDATTFNIEDAQIGFTINAAGEFNALMVYNGASYTLAAKDQPQELQNAINGFIREIVPTIPTTDPDYDNVVLGSILMDNPIHRETFNYLTSNFALYKENGNIAPVMKDGAEFEDAMGNKMVVSFYTSPEGTSGVKMKYYSHLGGNPLPFVASSINELYRNLMADPQVQRSMNKSRISVSK
jgi:hypothetical protein